MYISQKKETKCVELMHLVETQFEVLIVTFNLRSKFVVLL